jgi:hypothetical protein
MVPVPIALLALLFGMMATLSAASVWQILTGVSGRSVFLPLLWLAISAAAMFGLPLMKAWGRRVAILGAWLLAATVLASAGLLVGSGRPAAGLLTAIGAGLPVLVIRYLGRPSVKVHFTHPSGSDAHT